MSTTLSAPHGAAARRSRTSRDVTGGPSRPSLLQSMRTAGEALVAGYAAYLAYEELRRNGLPPAEAAAEALGHEVRGA